MLNIGKHDINLKVKQSTQMMLCTFIFNICMYTYPLKEELYFRNTVKSGYNDGDGRYSRRSLYEIMYVFLP